MIFFITCLYATLSLRVAQQEDSQWEYLIDRSLSKWNVYMGVPHYTVNLDGYPKGDGKRGTAIGLNNDPMGVFTVSEVEGQPILRVSGEIYAGLSTKKQYENYHLSLWFKWGVAKYEPRLSDKRDSGILYHAQEPHGQFWNVWMKAQEMQVQEADCGDYHPLAGVSMEIRAQQQSDAGEDFWYYDPESTTQTFQSEGPLKRCRRIRNHEQPIGHWNHLELVCLQDRAYHIVNGKVVMVLENSKYTDKDGQAHPLTAGYIQLQSEGAELYYKEIKIRPIARLPHQVEAQIRNSEH